MLTLNEALSKIDQGWNLSREISERAVIVRSHAQKGHVERAEEVAFEIDTLQRAMFHRSNPTSVWEGDRTDGIVWRMSTAAWADKAVHGYLLSRYLVTPFGTSHDNAEALARRILRPRLPLSLERVDQFQRVAA
ncbi:hypothetical protein [Pseudooceanicola atlanticus]|uniref:Uncharacterized protein n=1 Tax=Pseudooceanicola atlanticus TaxID=1461694 RepID=A0A0A0EKE8_9RHOB|nr:hypothetical protein [Pseudooceanicola atlanticus]KGM50643.1 hypothetical protein ATO9_03965 [Pseudooceanicola atlanticus]